MNPHVFSALEKLKTGDLKSAMDQVKFLCSQISELQQDVININTELEKKVALQSRMNDGSSTISVLGSGVIATITSSGTVLNGSATFFVKETAIGNQIKIGSEIVTITAYNAITPDTKITVTPAITGTYVNQIYAIIKPSTKEVLKGDFNFGELNGSTFNGYIASGSKLEHRGRMSDPNDVVNVQFVQKNINPVMVRAQNAIQRDGDTITGLDASNRYVYNYENTNINFGTDTNTNVEVNYYGLLDNDNSVVTKGYVDDMILGATLSVRNYIQYYSSGSSINLGASPTSELNFLDNYFIVFGTGLKCIKKCMCLIQANFNGYTNNAKDQSIKANLAIKQNSMTLNMSNTHSWSSSASNNTNQEEITATIFAFTTINVNETISIPLDISDSSGLVDSHTSVGILAIGL